jgi:hypothetical protein
MSASSFNNEEDNNGVKFTWNVWSASRLEMTRNVVPLAAIYTPLKETTNLTTVPYMPIQCKGPCKTILNPYWYATHAFAHFFSVCAGLISIVFVSRVSVCCLLDLMLLVDSLSCAPCCVTVFSLLLLHIAQYCYVKIFVSV